MTKILKFLSFLTGLYNNLPEEKKKVKNAVNRFQLAINKNQKPEVMRSEGKPSRRKGPRHSSEIIYNHPRKDFHS